MERLELSERCFVKDEIIISKGLKGLKTAERWGEMLGVWPGCGALVRLFT